MKNLIGILAVLQLNGDCIDPADHGCFAPHRERVVADSETSDDSSDDSSIMDDGSEDDD